jgi:hydroxyisourate hydrolase
MSSISTHVLDTVTGKPAPGIPVRLDKWLPGTEPSEEWKSIARGATDADGRCADLVPAPAPGAPEGLYRLRFDVHSYFGHRGRSSIYPEITIQFHCDGEAHYHLPLLLSDNSYTTYRGS